jgi:hypothetical protein
MQSKSSKPRPSIASALERVLRDVEPGRALPVQPDPATGTATATTHVPTRYFSPGDYAGERDWWAKQLGQRG